ncbi:hypothetical protein EDD85DRAFT_943419 [Armillaria nabsnona]|nr:hypothetical protein EDD85DRAFT_943419 [Armillaria nabsnona]
MSSSSQTQTVVDPTLSQDNDNFLDSFLDQMACSRPSPSTMTHTFKLSLPPFDVDTEDNEDLRTAVSQQPDPTVPFATSLDFSLPSCASLIKQLKQVKAFSKESTLDLDNFSVAPTIKECYTFMFATTLETRDLLKELVKQKTTEVFEIKKPVKKLITLHAKAFIFSSMSVSYVSPDIPEKVLLAMQANNTPDLPLKQDIIGKDKIIREINSALSDACHWLKSKLSDTLKKANPETDNIGAVTSRIVRTSGIPATLQLHMRVAVICWHLSHFPNLVPKKFWPHVDDFLARSLDKGHQSYMIILNNMYQQDMEEYGNHDLAKFPVLDLLEDSGSVNAWITTDNTFYDKIRPQKLMAKDRVKPQFTEENQAGEKRKRMESNVGGPEEEV